MSFLQMAKSLRIITYGGWNTSAMSVCMPGIVIVSQRSKGRSVVLNVNLR